MSVRCLVFSLLICLNLHALADLAFDPLLSVENLWALKQNEFQRAAAKLPFEWTSSARDSARAADKEMTLFGLPVYEVVARFDGEKPKRRSPRPFMHAAMRASYRRRSFGNWFGEHPMPFRSSPARSSLSAEKIPPTPSEPRGLVWKTDKARYLLEYSFTPGEITRYPFSRGVRAAGDDAAGKKSELVAVGRESARAKFNGALHVKRDAASGDVWLPDVPMVDQGQKGYCVVASTERVMRYYGNQVDANELAQIANTETDGGTSPQAMNTALKKIAARLKVRVRPLEESDVRSVLDLIKDYNRAAKKTKAPEIADPGNYIDVGRIYGAMDFEVLKEARTKSKSDVSRFQRAVQTHIEAGIPLLWSVQLGLSKEPGIPQNAGGHMRLIIGYNNTKQEILFSDSWGAGHELKRMPALNAWTITTGLTTLEPF